ncbi:galactose-binding domain-containing protein [Pontiella sulfatireligans]|uniref:F5/8 type C domain-containing protein n=1 Tax=Pontiella sulfatireligans TaxID=2750658 RepID=A0A6C2UQ44_9BACT|nr:discoidin domain-containing protein [Pontiella sulfatireligans]VGO22328.1 hypothetical protein SCARR_04411 [Pontiella sulfatireligans]
MKRKPQNFRILSTLFIALLIAGAALAVERPRLVLPEGGFVEIKSRIERSPRHAGWYADVKKAADNVVEAEVKIGRNTQADLMNLALVHKVEGGKAYQNKAKEILAAAYEKPMWDKKWALDQAMVSVGVAVALDWLYDDLPAELRAATERNLAETSLALFQKTVDGGAWWMTAKRPDNTYYNNHNGVCVGASLVVASALLGTEHDAAARKVIVAGLGSLKVGTLDGLLPDGAWDEGSGYFGYGMTGMTLGLSSVQNSLGSLSGLLDHPGIGKTGRYLVATTGPTGTFNYADGTSRINSAYWMCWLAQVTDDAELAAAFRHLQSLENHRGSVLGLCWDDPSMKATATEFPLDATFGRIGVGTARSSWDDESAAWVGFKFGRPWQSHAHSDVGSFVYDWGGVRWITDLSGAPYINNYFSYEDARYHFYRAKPEGHNTIVINPTDAYQQIIDSDSEIVTTQSTPSYGWLMGDMTPAYADAALKVNRGFMLDRYNGNLLVKDELTLKKPSEVWWFAHTAAEVELMEDGKTALLRSNGKTVRLEVIMLKGTPPPVLTAEPARPLPTSRVIVGEYPDAGKITRLALRFDDVKDLKFSVAFRPQEQPDAQAVPAIAEIPLSVQMVRVAEGDASTLLDGDWTTVWSANSYVEEDGEKIFKPQFIEIDLGKSSPVSSVGLGFDTAFQRRYDFKIHVSTDGKTWEQVFHGHSSKREGEQRFHFPAQKARFIKIEGLGNERYQNRYNLLKLFGPVL